jgi:hypothetical protein
MQLAELVRRGVLLPQSRAGVTTVLTRGARQANATGHDAYELMRRLFLLCRSLTGDGVRPLSTCSRRRSDHADGGPEWHEGLRLDRVRRVEHPRRVHRGRRRRARRGLPTLLPAVVQRTGADNASARGAAPAPAHASRPAGRSAVPDPLLRPHLGLRPLAPGCSSLRRATTRS